jgi:RNA polymerase primary sigma factor
VHAAEEKKRVERTMQRFSQRHGRRPEIAELETACALPGRRLQMLIAIAPEPTSLDAPASFDRATPLLETLGSGAASPYERAAEGETCDAVAAMLGWLRPRERQVLELRFGIRDDRPRTLAEVGALVGLTRERVRQIEQAALRKLRRATPLS